MFDVNMSRDNIRKWISCHHQWEDIFPTKFKTAHSCSWSLCALTAGNSGPHMDQRISFDVLSKQLQFQSHPLTQSRVSPVLTQRSFKSWQCDQRTKLAEHVSILLCWMLRESCRVRFCQVSRPKQIISPKLHASFIVSAQHAWQKTAFESAHSEV